MIKTFHFATKTHSKDAHWAALSMKRVRI